MKTQPLWVELENLEAERVGTIDDVAEMGVFGLSRDIIPSPTAYLSVLFNNFPRCCLNELSDIEVAAICTKTASGQGIRDIELADAAFRKSAKRYILRHKKVN